MKSLLTYMVLRRENSYVIKYAPQLKSSNRISLIYCPVNNDKLAHMMMNIHVHFNFKNTLVLINFFKGHI